MTRLTISPELRDTAEAAVPAPTDHSWQWDPAASGDRLRLFVDPSGPEVCVVYGDGSWAVDSLTDYQFAAHGEEGTLQDGMRRALKVAHAIGWKL